MKKHDDSLPSTPKQNEGTDTHPHVNGGTVVPVKTPMYQAMHSDRYMRQMLIKQIQNERGSRLICYVSGIATGIHRDDTLGFVDLLHNVPRGSNLDLLLHTPGGDINAAEKLISMVHATVEQGVLRVIIPDFAKSAGTLMALGANKVVMSDSSELGPIDPQINLNDGRGNLIVHSVLSYLDAYNTHSEMLQSHPNNVVAKIMLGKLNPETVKFFEAVRDCARSIAEKQLKQWMFQNKTVNHTKIVGDLMDIKRWPSHGQMISWQDATQMELEVEYLDPQKEPWLSYWKLYCLQRLAVKDRQKLFESDYVSLVFDGP